MHHFGAEANRRSRFGSDGLAAVLGLPVALALLAGCQPTVKVQAPDKPIVINLNVKIEQDVRVRLEKGVEEAMEDNPDIF